MGKEIAVTKENQIIDFKAKATEWLENMGTKLPPQQTAQFLELCQAYKLNPFKREIYAVGYNGKFNIIVGYEVYIRRAERIGKLDGWKCITNDNNTKAKITIYRKDWKYPFEHEVLMDEVKQSSPIWSKMPIFMMKKVCIEQGFRLCFPDEMGGMPYGEEEVSYDTVIASEKNITPVEEVPAEVIEGELVDENPSEENILQNKDKQDLKNLINNYEKELSIKSASNPVSPYDQCCEALAEDNSQKISACLTKCKSYLSKKGIMVA